MAIAVEIYIAYEVVADVITKITVVINLEITGFFVMV